MERKCELCPARAALYCAADEAYVCWECDSNVHGANFLVARHYRSVLCRQCSSPTLWRASGARFHPTTCLCTLCQSGNPGSCGSGKISDDNQTESVVRSSAVATSQSVRGSDPAGNGTESNIMICSSSSQAKVKSSPSPKFAESSKIVKSSSNDGCAPESRPRSPVSVISSGRSLVKKRRTLVVEQGSIESSSDSDPEDFSEVTDSRDTEDPGQILDFPFNWTESFLFPTTSIRRRSLMRLQNRTLDQVQGTSNYQLTVLDVRQLGHTAEGRMERVFWNWHDQLNLRSRETVALAMHVLRRFSCAIKVSDIDRLDARIFLAGCLWIAIKLYNPGAVGSRSRRLYEQCTGIPFRVLLAAETHIYQLLNWSIDLDGCTEGMPRWAMNDA